MERDDLFDIRNLTKVFPVFGGIFPKKVGGIRAAENVTFKIKAGEILGLVGESGCGKSTVGRLLLKLIEPTSGSVYFEGKNLHHLSHHELLGIRKDLQIVFQDPFSSLNPRVPVGKIIGDSLRSFRLYDYDGARKRVREVMDLVGLDPSLEKKYPHEFSGGDRQRIGIATALAGAPKFIFFDEPVSALDVSAQAQILNLIKYIRDSLRITTLIVAHNLSVVEYVSDRVAVMYLGKMMEIAPRDILYESPAHPYTQALMSAIPVVDPDIARTRQEIVLRGEIPSSLKMISGCKFHTRCQEFMGDVCIQEEPPLLDIGKQHYVACHLHKSCDNEERSVGSVKCFV